MAVMPLSTPKDLTILADVVDNFGDIGVSWRLCRNLLRTYDSSSLNLRLVTNNLKAFSNINNQIKTDLPYQECVCGSGTVKIYDWNNSVFCYEQFTKNPPEIILEMFQCGYPAWLEKILFEDRVNYKVHIIMVDYLTAETWADDFHCLKSLTRTAWVPKVNFMPGFSSKTGGLLTIENGISIITENLKTKNGVSKVLFFAYEDNWLPVIRSMNKFLPETCIVSIAGGAGQNSILEACNEDKVSFKTEALSYMNQEDWDNLMHSVDFMIIRGEDSMAQACLTGTPFIWQAYPQKENYQLVKVEALLERMRPHFGKEFSFVERTWKEINNKNFDESLKGSHNLELEKSMLDFLSNIESLKQGFSSFAESLYKNGDLSVNLMTFIEKNIKIEK